VAQALHVYHCRHIKRLATDHLPHLSALHISTETPKALLFAINNNYFQFIFLKITCFDDESTEKKKTEALLHLRKHDKQLLLV
jgi:hypothetical protein